MLYTGQIQGNSACSRTIWSFHHLAKWEITTQGPNRDGHLWYSFFSVGGKQLKISLECLRNRKKANVPGEQNNGKSEKKENAPIRARSSKGLFILVGIGSPYMVFSRVT